MSALLQTETALHQNGVKIIVCTQQRSALHQIDQCTTSDRNRTTSNRLKSSCVRNNEVHCNSQCNFTFVCTAIREPQSFLNAFLFEMNCTEESFVVDFFFYPSAISFMFFYSSTTTEWIVWKKFNVFAAFLATRELHFSHVPNLQTTRIWVALSRVRNYLVSLSPFLHTESKW